MYHGENYFQDSWNFNIFQSIKDNIYIYDDAFNDEGSHYILKIVTRIDLNNLDAKESQSVWYQRVYDLF